MLYHAAMVHGIAQPAFFGNGSTVRVLDRTCEGFMLVRINGPLARCETEQQHPGENDMPVTFFHQQDSTTFRKSK